MFALGFSWLTDLTFQKHEILIKKFGSLEKAFYRESKSLGVGGNCCIFFEEILKELEVEKIKTCYIKEEDYPKFLKKIYSPPPIIYYKGNININWDNSVSIVGSRDESHYARRVINDFVPKLTNLNINTISGLAIGVDTLVHKSTIESKGQTTAVLGAGLSAKNIYPRRNKFLAEELINNNSLIMSEFSPNTKVLPYNFPRRNRIIAGLSKYTFIIEAKESSGSLITAKYALEEGREVLTLIGSIYNQNSLGTNKLAKDGANIITNINDLVDILDIN